MHILRLGKDRDPGEGIVPDPVRASRVRARELGWGTLTTNSRRTFGNISPDYWQPSLQCRTPLQFSQTDRRIT